MVLPTIPRRRTWSADDGGAGHAATSGRAAPAPATTTAEHEQRPQEAGRAPS